MRILIYICLMCFSLTTYGQYYLTDDVAIWITDTPETIEFNVGWQTFRSGLNIEVITHREHLQRIIDGWLVTHNIGDVALLSRHYRQRPSLAFVADIMNIYWMDN